MNQIISIAACNAQPISKPEHRDADDHSVVVHSIFYTVQGEGPLSGHPAIFVRLSGCNLQCPQCDTEYTEKALRMEPEAIVRDVAATHEHTQGPRLVVITGGEPFRQAIGMLCALLTDNGYQVQIETNGTLPPPSGLPLDTVVVVSPKTGKVHPDTAAVANAYKYVLNGDSYDPADGLPIRALGHTAHPRVARPPEGFPLGAIYVQAADRKDPALNAYNERTALAACKKFGYTFQIQLHKYLNVE